MKKDSDAILKVDLHILRHGDKVIWGIVILLLLFSLLGVISTSTIQQVSSISSVFITFARDVLVGVFMLLLTYWLNYKLYRGLTWIIVLLSIGTLLWAFVSGTVIGGQSAGRWVRIFGLSFQPSAFALIAMVMFTARYLEKYSRDTVKMLSWKRLALDLWGPVLLMFVLITPHNLSTGLIFLFTFYVILLVGRYPLRHIFISWAIFAAAGLCLYGAYKANPEAFKETRVPTWVARVDNFFIKSDGKMSQEDMDKYRQVTAAKTAIALGGTFPAAGPGKSIQKYFLSQADSDFIFSILVEEYSIVGGAFILLLFVVFTIRVTVQAFRVEDLFGLLVLCGLLCVIMCQAITHTGVNVGMIPVTGQNLPFISSGGTSIIASCIMVGIMQKIIMNSREKALADAPVENTGSTKTQAAEEEDMDRENKGQISEEI